MFMLWWTKVVMTMRVYALYQRSRSILIPLLALWFGALVVGCVRISLSGVQWLIQRSKWAVFSSNFSSSTSVDRMTSQRTGNVGCPSDSYLSSDQWAISLLYLWSGASVAQSRLYVTSIFKSNAFHHPYKYFACRHSNRMERTARLWLRRLLTYPRAVTADSQRTESEYNTKLITRWYVFWTRSHAAADIF